MLLPPNNGTIIALSIGPLFYVAQVGGDWWEVIVRRRKDFMSTQLIAVHHRHHIEIPERLLDISSFPQGSLGSCCFNHTPIRESDPLLEFSNVGLLQGEREVIQLL